MADKQLVTPLDKLDRLNPFEGRQVIGVGIETPSAGGGLHDSLTIDPQEFHADETVFVVMECKVKKVRFDPIRDANAWRRVHVLDVVRATIAEQETVESLLEEQARRIEEIRGIQRLDFDGEDPEGEGEPAEDGEPEPAEA